MASSSSAEENSAAVPPPEEGGERRNWLDLPREVTASILSRLVAVDILGSAQFVCKAWLEISNDPLLWKRIDMSNLDDRFSYLDLLKMFCCAVDRSRGQAVDISINSFGNDDILKYLSDRSTHIKRLQLICCYHVSDKGMTESVAKLPLLEELELTLCCFAAEPIEAVGRNCPCLKSFKFNSQSFRLSDLGFDPGDKFNAVAIVIGKYMPELCHLQLTGNLMSNNGLKAILDGCPKLESLDLRQCVNISLNGSIWKRCTDQVKHLRLPDDSTEDCHFQTGPKNQARDNGAVSLSDGDYPYSPYRQDFDFQGEDDMWWMIAEI